MQRVTFTLGAILLAGIPLSGCDSTPTKSPAATATTLSDIIATQPALDPKNPTTTAPGTERPVQNITVVLPPISNPPAGSAVSPEMLEALRALSAEDYKTRQDAVSKLQLAMSRHFQQMILVQDMMLRIQAGLAEQLRTMTLTPDVETSARTASLMEFDNALSRWAIDVMALPDDQRKSMIDWGLKPENLTLVAKVYARKEDVRVGAARELAKLDGEQASWMLVTLINDNDREVSLTAMDAVWDRAPTQPIVDALWNRAMYSAMAQVRTRTPKVRVVTVRGRTFQIYDQDYSASARILDGDVAADVLIKYKNPLITEKLNGLYNELNASMANTSDYRWRVISSSNGDATKPLIRLTESYKPRDAVPALVKMLSMNNSDGYDSTINNNEKVRYSTKIDASVLIIRIIGQDPDDYNIRKYANWGDRWLLKGTVTEENELVKRIQTWWKSNAKDYGVDLPDAAGPTTKSSLTPPPPVPAGALTPPPVDPAAAAEAAKMAAAKAAEELEARKAAAEAAIKAVEKPKRVRLEEAAATLPSR